MSKDKTESFRIEKLLESPQVLSCCWMSLSNFDRHPSISKISAEMEAKTILNSFLSITAYPVPNQIFRHADRPAIWYEKVLKVVDARLSNFDRHPSICACNKFFRDSSTYIIGFNQE